MKMFTTEDRGVTVKELKRWLEQFPSEDPETGEDREVWMMTGHSLSSPVTQLVPLNKGPLSSDVCFHCDVYGEKS